MKNNKGFTLIELLAVIIILGLLIILAVPSYTTIYASVKRNNHDSKVTEINAAAQKYGSKIKDDIKATDSHCKVFGIDVLIKDGLLMSEEDKRAVIYDPTTNQPMSGVVSICYCRSTFDIQSFYAEDYVTSRAYSKGEYVRYNDKIYKVSRDTKRKDNSIAKMGDKDSKNRPYFEELTC